MKPKYKMQEHRLLLLSSLTRLFCFCAVWPSVLLFFFIFCEGGDGEVDARQTGLANTFPFIPTTRTHNATHSILPSYSHRSGSC